MQTRSPYSYHRRFDFLERYSLNAFRGQDPALVEAFFRGDERLHLQVQDDCWFFESGEKRHLILKARIRKG